MPMRRVMEKALTWRNAWEYMLMSIMKPKKKKINTQKAAGQMHFNKLEVSGNKLHEKGQQFRN